MMTKMACREFSAVLSSVALLFKHSYSYSLCVYVCRDQPPHAMQRPGCGPHAAVPGSAASRVTAYGVDVQGTYLHGHIVYYIIR